MIKAVIFDMDGVIINSEWLFYEVEKKMFEELGIPFNVEEIDTFVGRTAMDFWNHFITKYKLTTIDELSAIEMHTSRYLKRLKSEAGMQTIPGVQAWMKAFKQSGIKMILASSSRMEIVETVLDRFKLRDYLEHFVSGDMVTQGKPNPEIFLKAASILEISPENCLVIEDSENGIRAAKNAGMYCLGFQSGNQDHTLADMSIDTFDSMALNLIKDKFNMVLKDKDND